MPTSVARFGCVVGAAEENACPIGGRPGLAKRGKKRITKQTHAPVRTRAGAARRKEAVEEARRGGHHEGAGIERGPAGTEIPNSLGCAWTQMVIFPPFAQERMAAQG